MELDYCALQIANNKGADQTARMCRLVCACVFRKPLKTGFLTSRPIWPNLNDVTQKKDFNIGYSGIW